MSALKETQNGDLDFSTHNLVVVTDLPTVTAQKAQDVLWLFLGEWFLDASVGTPWFQLILGVKNPDFTLIRSAIRGQLLAIAGVSDVRDILFNWVPATRTLTYTINILLSTGQTVTVTQPPPLP